MDSVEFHPGFVSGGVMSSEEAHRRTRSTTRRELEKLRASDEFKAWEQRQGGTTVARPALRYLRPQFLLAITCFIIVLTLAATSVSLRQKATRTPPSHLAQQEPKTIKSDDEMYNSIVKDLRKRLSDQTNLAATAAAGVRELTVEKVELESELRSLSARLDEALRSTQPGVMTWKGLYTVFVDLASTSALVRFAKTFPIFVSGAMASIVGLSMWMAIILGQVLRTKLSGPSLLVTDATLATELQRVRGHLATATLKLAAATKEAKVNANDGWEAAAMKLLQRVQESADAAVTIKVGHNKSMKGYDVSQVAAARCIMLPDQWLSAVLESFMRLEELAALDRNKAEVSGSALAEQRERLNDVQNEFEMACSKASEAEEKLSCAQEALAYAESRAEELALAYSEIETENSALENKVCRLERDVDTLTALAESVKAVISIDNHTSHIHACSNEMVDSFGQKIGKVADMLGSDKETTPTKDQSAGSAAPLHMSRWLSKANGLFTTAETLLGAKLQVPSHEYGDETSKRYSIQDQDAHSDEAQERLQAALDASSAQVTELLAALRTAGQLAASGSDAQTVALKAEEKLRCAHDMVSASALALRTAGATVMGLRARLSQMAATVAVKHEEGTRAQKDLQVSVEAKLTAERDIDAANIKLDSCVDREERRALLNALDMAVEAKRQATQRVVAAQAAVDAAEEGRSEALDAMCSTEGEAAEAASARSRAAGDLQTSQRALLVALENANMALKSKSPPLIESMVEGWFRGSPIGSAAGTPR